MAATTATRASPTFASLEAIQSALADNEALLSFQVGIWETYEGEFGGGSWLIALTRHGRAVYRIPDRAQLAPMVPVFTGLLARNDGAETAAAVRLYNEILADALNAPSAGNRPADPRARRSSASAAVRCAAGGPRSRRRSRPATSSSWRRRPRSGCTGAGNAPRTAGRRALAFADPELGDRSAIVKRRNETRRCSRGCASAAFLMHDARAARSNGTSAASTRSSAGEASERALKDRDLRQYHILHFAAHAIADETHPERSAVLLSPGADVEDGLLQAREIEGLDLEGRIVVLSACQTASGAVLSGEGVLSLARAFFEAGAQAVIGTRWPIRDEDAAALFDTFYRVLGGGASLAEALTQAKIEAIAGRAVRRPHGPAWCCSATAPSGRFPRGGARRRARSRSWGPSRSASCSCSPLRSTRRCAAGVRRQPPERPLLTSAPILPCEGNPGRTSFR